MSFKVEAPLAAAVCLALLLAACEDGGPSQAAAGAPAHPPAEVGVVTVAVETIPIVNDLPGRIAPTRIAEVRPRVSGIVEERVFRQGSTVAAGDVLYRIDPAQFAVQVESARATLERAEAAQLEARQASDRQMALRKRNIVSQQQYESAVAALAKADADVAAARANLRAAELDLAYAEVRAPIAGRIGRALITEDALVGPAVSGSLATIQHLDPVYADFTQSASELLALRRRVEVDGAAGGDGAGTAVRLVFDDGTAYRHAGRLLFSEAAVDATTGQVTLRAEFPNPEGDLLPGMYVRVLIEQGTRHNAIAVPQQAVQRSAGGDALVYVVAEAGTVEARPVTAGRMWGDRWIIAEGLRPGDRVIVEGFQKIRPGASVRIAEWDGGTGATPALPPQAAAAD